MNNFAVGVVKEGHGVASGKNFDARFPDGTIAMQMPYFKRLGIDLKSYFKGTINIFFQIMLLNSVNLKFAVKE